MLYQTKQGFPWSQYIDWERTLQFPLGSEIIGALGILFPLSLVGAVRAIRTRRFDHILMACWLFVPLLFIPFAPKFNLSNIRLIQGVPYLPLAILAVMGINAITDFVFSSKICAVRFAFLAKLRKGKRELKFPKASRVVWLRKAFQEPILRGKQNLLSSIILLLFIVFTYPTLKWSLTDQIREYTPIFGNVYFDNRLNNAFSFINQNYPPKTVTLSTFYTGNYLPAFTHTVSYIGHFGYTYNIGEKDKSVRRFFENKMTEKEAKDMIVNNKITLIIQGPEEKPLYTKYLYPQILKPVYDKDEMTIYILK